MDNNEIVSLTSRVRHRAVGEEGVLVHLDNGSVLVVNEVGLHVVKLLDRPCSRENLAENIASEFDVSIEQAASDLAVYLEQLDAEHLLEHRT